MSFIIVICLLILISHVLTKKLSGPAYYRSTDLENAFNFDYLDRKYSEGVHRRDYTDCFYLGVYHADESEFSQLTNDLKLLEYTGQYDISYFTVYDLRSFSIDWDEKSGFRDAGSKASMLFPDFKNTGDGATLFAKRLDSQSPTQQYISCYYHKGIVYLIAEGLRDSLLSIRE